MPTKDCMSGELEQLKRGVVEITSEAELVEMLQNGGALRVKCGFDPTAPDLHLGHAVLLRKLKQFQDWHHKVTIVIGDFTAAIGDPTGRNTLRPPLDRDEIASNAKQFVEQVLQILDKDKTCFAGNANWFDKQDSRKLLELMATQTVSQILEREDFSKRFDSEQPIHLHELVYPLLQGFDSVMLHADIEIGGTDQKFNLHMGRELQRKHGQKPQVVMTMPIINGIDGVQKMSKSLGNHIGLRESAADKFGKLMSIPDDLIAPYRRLLTDLPEPGEEHPMLLKKQTAHDIVRQFHGDEEADRVLQAWVHQFQQRGTPEMETVDVKAGDMVQYDDGWLVRVDQLLVSAGLASSKAEANRKIKEGAVTVDGNPCGREHSFRVWVPDSFPVARVLRLGRKWKRVQIVR